MKVLLSTLAAAIALTSTSVAAQWEIDVHAGFARVASDAPVIEGIQILKWDTRDQASGVEFRYQTAENFYVLMGYEDLGEGESRVLAQGEQASLAATVAPTLAEGYTFGVGYTLWQQDMWKLALRGGLFVWEADTRSSANSGGKTAGSTGSDLFYGVNLDYRVSEKFSTSVGYQGYTPETGHTDQWKVGVTYHF